MNFQICSHNYLASVALILPVQTLKVGGSLVQVIPLGPTAANEFSFYFSNQLWSGAEVM